MKSYFGIGLAMLAGAAIGAAAVQGLHAQTKPPAYSIAEVDISNPEAYMSEFAPLAGTIFRASGGQPVAAGKPIMIEGEPQTRVSIWVFDNMEKLLAVRTSAEYKEARKVGDKYAKFRVYALEGLPPPSFPGR